MTLRMERGLEILSTMLAPEQELVPRSLELVIK